VERVGVTISLLVDANGTPSLPWNNYSQRRLRADENAESEGM
jgi:hypothetical protein